MQHLIYFFPNKNLVLSDWNNFYLYQIKPAKCKFSRSLVIHCLPFLFFWFSNRMNHHWYYFFCPQKHGLTTSQNNPALVLFTRLAIYRVSLLLKMSLINMPTDTEYNISCRVKLIFSSKPSEAYPLDYINELIIWILNPAGRFKNAIINWLMENWTH